MPRPQTTPPKSAQIFRTDTPPADLEGENDAFGHRAYATAIASALLEVEPPYTFGLFGPFGLGKTTVIEETRKQLEGNAAMVVFDAWRYEGDALRRHFLRDVAKQLMQSGELSKGYVQDHLDPLDRTSTEPSSQRVVGLDRAQALVFVVRVALASCALWLAWKAVPSLGASSGGKADVGKLVASVLVALATFILVPLSQIVRVAEGTFTRGELKPELFAEEFSKMIDAVKSRRLVVAIDNLDRCSAHRIEEVFFTLSTFLEPVGVPKHTRRLSIGRDRRTHDAVFLIAADADALKRHLEAREIAASEGVDRASAVREDAGRYADDFLRKIIKASLTIKPILADDMRAFVQRETADFCELRRLGSEQSLLLVELATAALRYNPRRVKEFVANLELQLRVIEAREAAGALNPPIHEDVLLVAKVQLLQEEWPARYDAVWKNYGLLEEWQEDIPAQHFATIPGDVDDRFRGFMNVGRSIANANLRPLLRLKQAKEEANLPRFPEFHTALVEGRVATVDQLVGASQLDPGAWATRLGPLLREEVHRGFLAGARNLIEVTLSSETLASSPDVRPLLEYAADTPELRHELRNSQPELVLPAGASRLDDSRLNRIAEPFLALEAQLESSVERARSSLQQLAPILPRLNAANRGALTTALASERMSALYDLMQPIAEADADLVPEQAATSAITALGDPVDPRSAAFSFLRAWLVGRTSIGLALQDEVVGVVRSGLSVFSNEEGSRSEVETAQWIGAIIMIVAPLPAPSREQAALLATQLVETHMAAEDADLRLAILDLASLVLEWLPSGGNSPEADELAENVLAEGADELVTYAESRGRELGPRLRWAIHRKLTQVLLDASSEGELRRRAAAAIARIDPSDSEEELGRAMPELIHQGAISLASWLLLEYDDELRRHTASIEEAALDRAREEVPEISRDVFGLIQMLLPTLDGEKLQSVRTILQAQITDPEATADDVELGFTTADEYAVAEGFEVLRDEIVRGAFDTVASMDPPTSGLLTNIVGRVDRLDADRRRSLVAQLDRWVRTPGVARLVALSAIQSFYGATADERSVLVSALIDTETASVGDPNLRYDLLNTARVVRGRTNSRAARRFDERIQALSREQTDENEVILTRLGLREPANPETSS